MTSTNQADAELKTILDILEEHNYAVSVTASKYRDGELSEKELGDEQHNNYISTAKLIKQYGIQERIDEQKRTDGAYLRFLKHEGVGDEESLWLSHDQRLDELTALKDKENE